MDVNERIRELMNDRRWSEYRLAKESGLAKSTIISLFKRNNIASIPTIEAICQAMGITLAQFFTADEAEPLLVTDEQRKLLDRYSYLSPEAKTAINQIIDELIKNN